MQKTFDQLLSEAGPNGLSEMDVKPHRMIPCNMVLEPNTYQGVTRVRVTARDKDFNLLWGVNMSEGVMPSDHPTPVAIYGALRAAVREHLPDAAPTFEFTEDPYVAIDFCLKRIRETLNRCENMTVKVKNKSETTSERANRVAEILFDTLRKLGEDVGAIGISSGAKETTE
jgi:hypothetical protein